MRTLLLSILVLGLSATTAMAGECKVPPQKHSKEFDKLKTLEGKWEGSTMQGGKAEDVTTTYHVTSGGSAVVETLMPGTPHEMVSVYHDQAGKLTMTHYCMLGNQPKLDLSNSSPNEIKMEFGKGNAINPATEDHMNSVDFVFIDDDHMVQKWSGVHDGKQAPDPTAFKMARVK